MRAGTFFALSVAVVLGLGSAAGAKYLGFFDKKPDPVVTEKTPEKPAPTMVLAARTNLFKGLVIDASGVELRELRKDEEADYNTNRKDYLPAIPTVVNLRIPADNIPAGTILKVKHFEPQEIGSLGVRIDPYMRAVNVAVPKTRSAGGMIQTGERVDVFLTSKITDGSGGAPFIRTALLARDVKVIAKRDGLFNMMATNPDDKPVSFMLQANPYRSALIEFAQTSGSLSLVPRPKPRTMMGMDMGDKKEPAPKEGMPNFADPESKEYRDENERVAQIERSEYSIGTTDLVRVFNLPELPQPTKRIETPPPPMKVETPPPPAPEPIRVVTIKGVEKSGERVFGEIPPAPKPEVKPEPKPEVKPVVEKEQPRRGYRFYDLNAKVGNDKAGVSDTDCPTCGKS